MNLRPLMLCLGFSSLIAASACSSSDTSGAGGAGTTGAGGATGTTTGAGGAGGATGTTTGAGGSGGATAGTGGAGGGAGECVTCVCMSLSNEGGCAEICNSDLNGSPTPDFCNGAAASAECAACIASSCGVADPAQCH